MSENVIRRAQSSSAVMRQGVIINIYAAVIVAMYCVIIFPPPPVALRPLVNGKVFLSGDWLRCGGQQAARPVHGIIEVEN